MKKNVLVTYVINGSIREIVAKEIMFQKILDEMIDEGRTPVNTTLNSSAKSVKFLDGSKLSLKPINNDLLSGKYSELYIGSDIYNLPNSHEFIAAIKESVISEGKYTNVETNEVIKFYQHEDGNLDGVKILDWSV